MIDSMKNYFWYGLVCDFGPMEAIAETLDPGLAAVIIRCLHAKAIYIVGKIIEIRLC